MVGHGANNFEHEFHKCRTNARADGKVALITGATSGIGLETAKILAKRGAKVIIASRNPAKLAKATNDIIQYSGRDNVVARQVDFESLNSVRDFARETIMLEPRLDILVNNIGAVGLKDQLTQDGLQEMMQINYFGGFLLTFLLFPLLKASAPSRIINVSSIAMLLGQIELEHLNDVKRHSNFGWYGNAKLALTLSTIEMDRRIKGSGVSVYSMDPGMISTNITRNYDKEAVRKFLTAAIQILGRPSSTAAAMPVFLAVDPKVINASGKHFRDCDVYFSSWFANDTILMKNLWEKSKRLVGITGEEDWEIVKQDVFYKIR